MPLNPHLTPVISRELKLGCVPRLLGSRVATKLQETLVLSPYSARAKPPECAREGVSGRDVRGGGAWESACPIDALWGNADGRVCRPDVQERSACSSGFWAYWVQPQQMETMLEVILLTDTSSPRQILSRLNVSQG